MILNTFLTILVAIGVSEAGTPLTQCYAGSAYTNFIETPISISSKGCYNYFVGQIFNSSNILLALTSNQVACDQGQDLQIYDSAWNPYYDFCYMQKSGVTNHYISYQGTYLILQFTNNLAQIISSFIHYGLFNNINNPPSSVTAAPSSTAAPVTTATTTAAAVKGSCGIPQHAPSTTGMRIIGGIEANMYSWPWQVLLLTVSGNYEYLCGGSLINEQWIVTAAHCVVSGTTKAYLGVYYQNSASNGILVSKKIVNPGYISKTVKNDIALMKLSTPVTFNDKIQPICLPTSNLAVPGKRAGIVTGWGVTSTGGSTANPLMQVTVPIQTLDYCGFPNTDSTTQFCAGDANLQSPKDSCQGDSGGPLVLQNNGQYVLTGVVSYGGNVCNGQGIYTNVYAYVGWIQQTIASN